MKQRKNLTGKWNKGLGRKFSTCFSVGKGKFLAVRKKLAADKKAYRQLWLHAGVSMVCILLVVVMVFAMSAAWYTNVARTGNLTFQVESWGFDAENIQVGEEPITVAPGSSGVVPLTVDNSENPQGAAIAVTISKVEMVPELQKRIFYYVDATKTYDFSQENALAEDSGEEAAAAEVVSRIYLGASQQNSYTYQVPAGQTLELNGLFASDAPLKWEWVYDMVGYYFRGTVPQSGSVTVDEYLRPVSYDYLEAVYDETTNRLEMVGEQTTQEFLAEFSARDGYPGTISTQEARNVEGKLYYPVQVDEEGKGVWAYLCDRKEIETGIQWDTQYAATTPEKVPQAVISLTAMQTDHQITTVSQPDEFLAALTGGDIIRLNNDLMLGEPVELTPEHPAVIDLNGYSIAYTGGESVYNLFSVPEGGSLTLLNGDLTGNNQGGSAGNSSSIGVKSVGGTVTLSGIQIQGFDSGVVTSDMEGNGQDSLVQITQCRITALQTAMLIQGNGPKSQGVTRMIIKDSTIEGTGYIGISGQGTNQPDDARWGTELNLRNTEVTGKWAAVYQPQQQGVLNAIECSFAGYTGMAVKGGTVNLVDSQVEGTGAYKAAAASGGGWTDTGDGVYVEATYGWPATVTVKGNSEIISQEGYALQLFGKENLGPGRIMVYDGNFTGEKGSANFNGLGTFQIYGGTFHGAVQEDIIRITLEQ